MRVEGGGDLLDAPAPDCSFRNSLQSGEEIIPETGGDICTQWSHRCQMWRKLSQIKRLSA